MARSVKTASKGSARKRSIAAAPLVTTTARWPTASSTSPITLPTASSSSTTRQRSVPASGAASAGAGGSSTVTEPAGNVIRNVEPRPSAVSTTMRAR